MCYISSSLEKVSAQRNNAKDTQSPQTELGKPEGRSGNTSFAMWLVRIHVSAQIEESKSNPRRAQRSRSTRVSQTGEKGEEGSLGGVLEVVGMGALGAVEFFGFSLFGSSKKVCKG